MIGRATVVENLRRAQLDAQTPQSPADLARLVREIASGECQPENEDGSLTREESLSIAVGMLAHAVEDLANQIDPPDRAALAAEDERRAMAGEFAGRCRVCECDMPGAGRFGDFCEPCVRRISTL